MLKTHLMRWHKKIAWTSAVAMFIWGVSAITHPLMSWFGPQAERFYPPTMQVNGKPLDNLAPLIKSVANLTDARLLKLVPSANGPLLQLTQDQQSPRQYYDLNSQRLLQDQDRLQAQWLASYYTGLDSASIEAVEFFTEFSDEYPKVNRLLPVYKVTFGGDRPMQAFVYTETGALASLSNPFKQRLQWVFQHLHTLKWLDSLEYGRLILASLFMLCLVASAVVGFMLILSLKSRLIRDGKRRNHRRLGYILWLPLLAWSASGFYHLWQMSLVESDYGMRLDQPFNSLNTENLNTYSLQQLKDQSINSLSLLRGPDSRLYWRASVAQLEQTVVNREQRFAGKSSEYMALYLPATFDSAMASLSDAQLAVAMAQRFSGLAVSQLSKPEPVRRFGPDYDFRNKRLPVWKVELNDSYATTLFVDTATGILVDSNTRIDRAERWSFSVLHKWSPLTGLTGRKLRDGMMVATVALLLLVSLLGVLLLGRRKAKKL
ncbi:MAG: hypothetical protein ACPH45_01715 [Porticoccaceae bacterium]